MLIQLQPEQITANWDFLKSHIIDAVALELIGGENRSNNILNSLLLGDMQCWVECLSDEKGFRIIGIVLTQILTNDCVGIKNLLIYSLLGIEDVFEIEKWNKGLLTLTQFARANDCKNIIGYTDNLRIIRLAERFKANTSQRLVIFSLT